MGKKSEALFSSRQGYDRTQPRRPSHTGGGGSGFALVCKVAQQLWLEVTGFTFLVMAAVGAMAGVREYGKYQAGHASGPGRLLLAICFTISFAWFGLSSFWRVKRRVKS